MAFEKEWLRLMKAGKGVGEKLAFLQSVGGAGFVGRCFGKGKKEMAAEVLGDVLVTLREGMKEEEEEEDEEEEEEIEEVPVATLPSSSSPHACEKEEKKEKGALLSLLHALTQTGRFHLTYAFLTEAQQEAGREMVEWLEGIATAAGELPLIEEVRRAFPGSTK